MNPGEDPARVARERAHLLVIGRPENLIEALAFDPRHNVPGRVSRGLRVEHLGYGYAPGDQPLQGGFARTGARIGREQAQDDWLGPRGEAEAVVGVAQSAAERHCRQDARAGREWLNQRLDLRRFEVDEGKAPSPALFDGQSGWAAQACSAASRTISTN